MRSSWGKRRSATSDTNAGAIMAATTSSDTSTRIGVTAKITISGASTGFRPPAPMACSQSSIVLMSDDASRALRTQSRLASQ